MVLKIAATFILVCTYAFIVGDTVLTSTVDAYAHWDGTVKIWGILLLCNLGILIASTAQGKRQQRWMIVSSIVSSLALVLWAPLAAILSFRR